MEEKTKKMVVALFFAFLMVASVVGFAVNFVSQSSNVLEYHDYKFKVNQNSFETEINGQPKEFLFFPGDIEWIELPEGTKELLESAVIAATYAPNSTIVEQLAEAQYYLESQLTDKLVIERTLTNSTGTSLPEKDCSSATAEYPVIKLQDADNTSIILENNCLIISASNFYDLMQQTERVVYSAFGVME